MSLKSEINSVLKNSCQKYNDYKHFYGSSKDVSVPYVRFTLGNNHSNRLSNKKAIRNIWYQIDVFTYVPIDVEAEDTILTEIESQLEHKGLITRDWMESYSENNTSQYTIYQYFIEVRA